MLWVLLAIVVAVVYAWKVRVLVKFLRGTLPVSEDYETTVRQSSGW